MPFSSETSWMEPQFSDISIGGLKRLRNDVQLNNSDTSDGNPWKIPTSEVPLDYDYGDSFGYEVYMLKLGADELDGNNCFSSDDDSISVDELLIEREESCLGKIGGQESTCYGEEDALTCLSMQTCSQHVMGKSLYDGDKKSEVFNCLEDDDTVLSDSDSDSDGYESDFSYFTVSPVSVAPVVGRTLQFLVVDDSLLQRKISRCLLSGKVGNDTWMVNTADSGERALQVLESCTKLPDIIVVDQNMSSSGGKLLGHEVVEKIRKNSVYADMIIIGCTSYAQEASKYFLEAGCDTVWTKPMPSRVEAHVQICEIQRRREGVRTARTRTLERQGSQSRLFSIPPSLNTCQEALPQVGLFLSETMMV